MDPDDPGVVFVDMVLRVHRPATFINLNLSFPSEPMTVVQMTPSEARPRFKAGRVIQVE